ncbi:UNKNOWN [Stylonychia lemnae]|uniref:Uncharacterized protein n=1 Tax=Stylonychia lemnae TaxID=5949 RepID=A0A078A2E0_STYLE|nr:UNKNOWN [Stylonychia lemnae]|eukprot:CDW76371.1 UNKNOWN [Stylonychia lemnae]
MKTQQTQKVSKEIYDSNENSEEELNEEEYRAKIQKAQERRQKEYKKNQVTIKKLQDQTNIDLFFSENRIRKMCLELFEPLSTQQKLHQKQIGSMLEKIDMINYQVEGYLYEVHNIRKSVDIVDHLKKEFREMERRIIGLEQRQEERYNELSQKHYTMNDKHRSHENQLRTTQNSITLFNEQLLQVHKIVADQRDNANLMVRQSLTEITSRCQEALQNNYLFEEKMQRQNTILDNCKNLTVHFEKQLLEMQRNQKKWEKQAENKLKEESEAFINIKLKSIEENTMDFNRIISDVKQEQLEIENYISKYLPYNSMVEVMRALFYTVKDNSFYNELIDYSTAIKNKFKEELGELTSRLHTLNKKKVELLEIPHKKKIVVQELKFLCPHYKKESKEEAKHRAKIDSMHIVAPYTTITDKVKIQIRNSRRKASARIKKTYQKLDNFSFLNEAIVLAKDETRFHYFGKEIKYKVDLSKLSPMNEMIEDGEDEESEIEDQIKAQQQMQNLNSQNRSPSKNLNSSLNQTKTQLSGVNKTQFEPNSTMYRQQQEQQKNQHAQALQNMQNYQTGLNQNQAAINGVGNRRSTIRNVQNIVQQTIIKQVTDEKLVQELATLKRVTDYLKKEVQSMSDEMQRGFSDQKKNLKTTINDFKESAEATLTVRLENIQSVFKQEIGEAITNFQPIITVAPTKDESDLVQQQQQNQAKQPLSLQQQAQKQVQQEQNHQKQGIEESNTKVDENQIKKIVMSQLQRLNHRLQTQIDDIKVVYDKKLKEVQAFINGMANYERDMKMAQAQIKQLFKDNKQSNDKLGEQLFNLDEKVQENEQKFKQEQIEKSLEIRKIANESEMKFQKQLMDLEQSFVHKIQEGIKIAFPAFNIQIMEQVNELVTTLRQITQKEMQALSDEQTLKIRELEKQVLGFEVKTAQEKGKREMEDKRIVEQFDIKMKDLQQLIEIKFQRKQKTKVDFMIEIRNMHQQMKGYNDKFKESQIQSEIILDMFHFIKILELELSKLSHFQKVSDQIFDLQAAQIMEQQQALANQANFAGDKSPKKPVLLNQESLNFSLKEEQAKRLSIKDSNQPSPQVKIERSSIYTESLKQGIEHFESRASQLKMLIKNQLKEKSKNFKSNHEVDVEIDYITDHLSRLTSDQIMQIKINNMKQSKERERRPSIFKQTTQRLTTLERMLLTSNTSGKPEKIISSEVASKKNLNNSALLSNRQEVNNSGEIPNPYQLQHIRRKSILSNMPQNHQSAFNSNLSLSENKKNRERDLTPLQVKSQFLSVNSQASIKAHNSRNNLQPHSLYNNSQNNNQNQHVQSESRIMPKLLTVESKALSERSFDGINSSSTIGYEKDKKLPSVILTLNNKQVKKLH